MLQTHSILPGALSDIPCAFSTARLLTQDDSVFLVYASGDKIIFISQELTPIEKISAADLGLSGSLQVSAVSASEFRGVVAAAWGGSMFLFHTSTFTYQRNILRLQWTQIQHDPIIFRSDVRALAWNKLGTRLLASHGDSLTLYSLSSQQANEEFLLEVMWETRLAATAHLIKFSPDGQLFATCASQDRLIKVWYLQSGEANGLTRYTFSYLKHSTPVVGFSWRDTHLYMPKNGVPNALLSHTADNTAYVWVQRQSSNQEDTDPISLYHCTTISPQLNLTFISSLPAETFTFAPVWVNNKVLLYADHIIEMQKRDVYPYSADYNTDITTPAQTPTIPFEATGETGHFELPDTPQDIAYATSLLKRVKEELTLLSSPLPHHVTSQLLNRWRQASDLILAINPLDGSILIWDLDNLDSDGSSYSVKKHSLSSRMPHNIPMEDAQCISTLIGLALYPSPIETQHDTQNRPRFPHSEHSYFSSFHSRSEMEDLPGSRSPVGHSERSTKFLVDRLYFFSLHREGSLNVWHAMFSERSNYTCNVSGLVHVLTMGGHMFMEHSAKKHPSLPLMATVSQGEVASHGYSSDLILWRTDRIGMLNSSGGLKQTAKLLGKKNRDFSHTVWLPTLLCMKGNNVDSCSIPTGTFLLTSVDGRIAVFLALCISPLDIWSSTKETFTSINQNFTEKNSTSFSSFSNSNFPSFLYKLTDVIDIVDIKGEVLSIQVFSDNSLRNLTADTTEDVTSYEEFECRLTDGMSYIVLLENIPNTREQTYSVFDKEEGVGDQLMTTKTHVWRCEIRFDTSPDSAGVNSILDRRVSKVTLFYDMITKLACRLQVSVEKLNSEVLPFAGERLTFVEQVSQMADTGHNQFPPFLFSTLASNGIINNWKCEVVSEGIKWLHYPSSSTSKICLNTLLKSSNIFTPPTFLHVLTYHVANACLMAVCFKHAESNSRFVAVLISHGTMNWICEGVIELMPSSTLCRTQSPRLEWIPCGDGRYILVCLWGTNIGVYAKCYREQMQSNIELSELSEMGLSPLCGYVKSLAGKMGENGGSWVRIAAFEVPLQRVTELDAISMHHVGGGALLLCVNAVLVLLSPWIHQPWERGMTPTRFDSRSLSSSFSLFDISGCLKRYLPQYHPYVLLELVKGGMLDRLNMILLQVARSVVTEDNLRLGERRARAGSLSIRDMGTTLDAEYAEIYDYSDLDAQLFREDDQEVKGEEEVTKEVKYVPPLSLPVLQKGIDTSTEEDVYFSEFTSLIQSCLAKRLPACQLPDLLPLEAVELQAIVETLGNMKLLEGAVMVGGGSDQDVSVVDECGLRYRLALKRFVYCRENSSEKDFSSVMTPEDYVWAFHSVEQEKLMKDLPSVDKDSPEWDELREAGVCWWVRSVEMLRPLIQRLAKCRFGEKNDPLDAALFYLALNKQSVLKRLFKSVGNSKMSDFFAHDFHEDRWKRAAKKNAFKLMSLQRFETAVAFFLLGHSIWDAVEVCIDKLKDFQLALLITRLLEGDRGEHYHLLLKNFVLCKGDKCRDIPELNLNPYLRSMAYWQMDDYSNAIDTLLDTDPRKTEGSICNFYFYLKAHPLISKFRKHNGVTLSQDEIRLVFNTASHYLERGSPILAMLVIHKFDKEHFALTSRALSPREEVGNIAQELDTQINTGTLSNELFSRQMFPAGSKETSDSFDWSQPSFSSLASVDFEPPKLSEKAGDYDWSTSVSVNTSKHQPKVDLETPFDQDSLQDTLTLPYKEVPTDNGGIVLDMRPALVHAKFLTSLSFLCQSLSKLRAVNGEVLNSAKFNTSLRHLLSIELEQTAVNLGIKHEFTSLRPILLQLVEFLALSHESLPTKQASIALIYSLVSTDFSQVHTATKPTSSIPLYTSAMLPPAHFQNILSYAAGQVSDLFNFVKRFRFPFYPLSPDTGVDMIWPQAAIISGCILTSLSSLDCGYSHPSSAKDNLAVPPLYKLSCGSFNNKLASWPGNDREYINDVTHKRVTILLGECSACVLLALFANAYLQQNARLMSLLLHNTPNEKMWCEVFCGGEYGPPIGCPTISILDFYLREYSHPAITTAASTNSETVHSSAMLNDSDDSDITQPLSAYIWNLISLCTVKKVIDSVKHISTLIGIDNELPLKSPLLCQIKTQAQRWEKDLGDFLDSSCSLTEQIRSSSSNESSNSSSLRSMIGRHMRVLERDPSSLSTQMRELLEYLEQMEETRETLLYYLKSPAEAASVTEIYKPKVVFRDEDPVHAFCYSPNNPLVLALSTSKHIFEIDISRFDSGQWIEESDTPIEDPSPVGNRAHRLEDFLMVYQPTEKRESPLMGGGAHEQTGVTSSVLIKRAQLNVRRMEAHPELPYYLCGTQDGAVHLCQLHNEGIVQCLCKSHASITAIHFTHQGNKFGILDKDGSFSSCQGIYTSMSQPQKLITNCHSRSSEDFCYLSSSSFIATCGHAGDSANVRLWDLLMPPKRMVVKQFYCHPEGCTVLAYSQRHQQLISGGKKGELAIFDIRQQCLIQKIEAHTDGVRAIALNSSEDFYVTGCSNGSAKLWGLTIHSPIRTFSMLHPKSSIFRSEPGITQLSLTDDGFLLSSGGDGTIRRSAVHHLL